MRQAQAKKPDSGQDGGGGASNYDVLIIGAGMSGMYQLHRLRALGMTVRVLEAGSGVGGTWYWNRYPGARFDSESWSYGYSFSQEILKEWEWSEHFAPQPETLRYLEFVADKLDLRRDISFDTRVKSASFDDAANLWRIETTDGRTRIRPLPDHRDRTAVGADDAERPRHRRASRASRTTPACGRMTRSTSPASAWPSSAPAPAACRPSRKSRRSPAGSRSSSARPTGARRCTTRRSRPKSSAASRPATTRSSRAAARRTAASSTRPIRARRWKCRPRSAKRSTRSCMPSPASASGSATSATC